MTILHEPAVDCGFHSTDAKAEAMAAPAPAPAAHPLDAEEPILHQEAAADGPAGGLAAGELAVAAAAGAGGC